MNQSKSPSLAVTRTFLIKTFCSDRTFCFSQFIFIASEHIAGEILAVIIHILPQSAATKPIWNLGTGCGAL